MNQTIKYYATGHTAAGYVNYIKNNLARINKVVVIEHTSKQAISDVLKKIHLKSGTDTQRELLCSSDRQDDLEGIIFRDNSMGIISEHIVQDDGKEMIYVDLHHWMPLTEDTSKREKVRELQKEAYAHFSKGLSIHDELEDIYINQMDFSIANQLADHVIKQIFHDTSQQNGKSVVYKRLFGTNTMDGVVNEVDQLIAPIPYRIFIKGRAGTGKSVLMKKVLEQSIHEGYDTEVYHCSFDPNSIDMVIIRSLGYCLFDSTPPHEFFPTRKEDQIVDLYKRTVKDGTDEKFEQQINDVTKAYKAEMKKGLDNLKEMKYYEPVMQIEERKYDTLITEISNEVKKQI